MKIIICDDETKYAAQLKNDLHQCEIIKDSEIVCFDDANHLLTYDELSSADLIFLDIEMPNSNGIDIAQYLYKYYPHIIIIFFTNYASYISTAIKNHAFQFLLKPVNKNDLEKEIVRVVEELQRRKQKIEIIYNDIKKIVTIDRILYVESKDKMISIKTLDGDCYEMRSKLSSFYKMLEFKNFVYCHKSYLVNMRYVEELRNTTLVLANKEIIPISRRQKEIFKRAFNRYLNGVYYD